MRGIFNLENFNLLLLIMMSFVLLMYILGMFKKDKKTAYQIGLFLPFKLEESEAITIEDLVRSKSSFPNAQNISLDFYFGF